MHITAVYLVFEVLVKSGIGAALVIRLEIVTYRELSNPVELGGTQILETVRYKISRYK